MEDNQNSWDGIRSELDRLEQIPGEPAFNSNRAWTKLSLRLEKKPIHRKPLFYWLAAAILLLVFSVAVFTSTEPGPSGVVRIQPKKTIPITRLPDTTVLNEFADEAKKPYNPAARLTKKPARRKPTLEHIEKSEVKNDISPSVSIAAQPQVQIQVPPSSIESMSTDTAAVAQSKPPKLKVIHNNRLNSVIYKPELSVSNAPTGFPSSSGQFRFSRNASDNIVQIKLSLTN